MYCSKCGQNNADTAVTCASCGELLRQAAPPAPPAPPVPPAPPAPPQTPYAQPTYQQQYAAPASPYAAPQYGQAMPPMPPTYLWQSIVVLLLCCWPFGIPAVVFAAQVSSKYNRGDYNGALAASGKAKMWAIIALVCGLIGGALYAMLMATGAISSYSYY